MEKEYLSNNEFVSNLSPPHHFQPLLPQLQTHNGFGNFNSDNSTEQCSRFESALSSMVSSPVATNSATDVIAIRELVGKLGTICNGSEISPEFFSGNNYIGGVNNTSNTSSSYNTPMDSPSNLQVPIMNHFVKENLPISRNSTYTGSVLPALPTDPGFAERAAKFSCFGSKSFNGRTSQIGLNNADFQYRSSGLSLGNSKLHRVSSSPSLKLLASQLGIQENSNSGQPHMDMRPNKVNVSDFDRKIINISGSGFASNQETSGSAQNPGVENWLGAPMNSNSRKRKGFPRVKAKEAVSAHCANAAKDAGIDDKSYLNILNMACSKVNKNDDVKLEDMKGDSVDENDNNQKPPEPLKDYIHVRARRGQATDSHSLAERVRREKISKKMQLLQDLVPGCNKVTGKALMLDEIINYVQSLQRQVEFLSMKLATVNPRLDNNMENLLPKNITEPSGAIPYQIYPIYSSASMYNGHQAEQISQVHKTLKATDAALCRNVGMQLDTFGQGLSQFSSFSEDDLQSIVQMGLATNQTSHMKLEL